MPVTHGVAGSSPVRTANKKTQSFEIVIAFFFFDDGEGFTVVVNQSYSNLQKLQVLIISLNTFDG